jgi:hypothetical protein
LDARRYSPIVEGFFCISETLGLITSIEEVTKNSIGRYWGITDVFHIYKAERREINVKCGRAALMLKYMYV